MVGRIHGSTARYGWAAGLIVTMTSNQTRLGSRAPTQRVVSTWLGMGFLLLSEKLARPLEMVSRVASLLQSGRKMSVRLRTLGNYMLQLCDFWHPKEGGETGVFTMRHLILLAALLCSAAQAACLPAQLQGGTGSPMVVSYNKQGAWAGWWCPGASLPYVAVVTADNLRNVAMQRVVTAWLMFPSTSDLAFGSDPHTDAALRAVWVPERAKLDAVKPK
jgi:hypothetical protein